MIRPGRPVVVEGRYDRIRLASIIDGVILETGGFRIYKDRELIAALRSLARTTGLIIMTDSDAAGFQIRNYLTNVLGKDAKLTQVYIPAVPGRERRKDAPSAEGLLGVEGLDEETLYQAFLRAGVGCEQTAHSAGLTRADLYDARLIGAPDAASRRRTLLSSLGLPPRLSTGAMLELLNTLCSREEFLRRTAALEEAH